MTSALRPTCGEQPSPSRAQLSVVAFGELAAHVFGAFPSRPPASDTLRLGRVHLTLGGGSALVCQQLARLGHPVALQAMAGDDEVGTWLVSEVKARGVRCETPLRIGIRTGRTLVLHDTSGHHDIVHEPSDGTPGLLVAKVPDVWPDGVPYAYCPGFPGFEPVLEALARASAPIAVDLGYRPWLADPASYRASVLARAPYCHVCLLSGDGLARDQQARMMREASGAGASLVVLTLGADGSLILVGGEVVHVDAVPCSPVNTLGAGDALAAGLLAGLVEGREPAEALALGNATAAAVISAFPTLPDRVCVDRLNSGQ